MAIAIVADSTAPSFTLIKITYKDVNKQTATEYLTVDSDPGDTTTTPDLTGPDAGLTPAGELEKALTDLQALGNTILDVSLIRENRYVVTGFAATAIFQPQALVSDVAALYFSRPNPIKANSTLSATFEIPAPIVSSVGGHGGLLQAPPNMGLMEDVSNNAHLNDLVVYLQNHMIVRNAGNGAYYGGFTYDKTKSEEISFPDITDNK